MLLLKRPENLTDSQDVKLAELLQYNLRSVRSYLLKEDFQFFWKYVSPYWAGRFLDRWSTRVMRSQIEPMKKVARSLRKHRVLLLNWFHAKGPRRNNSSRLGVTVPHASYKFVGADRRFALQTTPSRSLPGGCQSRGVMAL